MKTKSSTITLNLKVKEFISNDGQTFKLDIDTISHEINKIIEEKLDELKQECKENDISFKVNSDNNPNEIFFKNFYITFRGSPYNNGGRWNFSKFDPSEKKDQENYKIGHINIIKKTLSANTHNRMHGFGTNDLAWKYVDENPETANTFIPFIFQNNIINPNELIGNDNSFKPKIKTKLGLMAYAIRSENFDAIEPFIKQLNLNRNDLLVIYEILINKIHIIKTYNKAKFKSKKQMAQLNKFEDFITQKIPNVKSLLH